MDHIETFFALRTVRTLNGPASSMKNPETGQGPPIIGLTDGQELAKRARCAKD